MPCRSATSDDKLKRGTMLNTNIRVTLTRKKYFSSRLQGKVSIGIPKKYPKYTM